MALATIRNYLKSGIRSCLETYHGAGKVVVFTDGRQLDGEAKSKFYTATDQRPKFVVILTHPQHDEQYYGIGPQTGRRYQFRVRLYYPHNGANASDEWFDGAIEALADWLRARPTLESNTNFYAAPHTLQSLGGEPYALVGTDDLFCHFAEVGLPVTELKTYTPA